MTSFFGKYRGKVVNNVDPNEQARLQVSVPAVLGEGQMSWAMPSVPFAGQSVGFFMIPPVNANVWVEFEGGNPDYPIWSGCFWGDGEVPASPATFSTKMIKTDMVTIQIDDLQGSISIETTAGAKIAITASGIEINNGQGATVKLSGPQVSVNDGALEVT